MAVTVEDGGQVLGANSYVTEAELTAYAANKGVTIQGSTEALLFRAALYTETLEFIGKRLTKLQKMQWPRSGVSIDGFSVATNEIPELLKTLQMETALSIDEGNDPLSTVGRSTKREKVGEIEVEYMDGASDSNRLTAVHAMASKLIGRHSGGASFAVRRG